MQNRDDNEGDRLPKVGDVVLRSADELGWDRAETIIKRSTSSRADPVKQLVQNALEPNAVFAQQFRRAARPSAPPVAWTRAITATGLTKAGDAIAATYAAEFRAVFSAQAETLRFGTNCILIKRGEETDVFGFVGIFHLPERFSFVRADFEEVRNIGVPTSALKAATEWTRGKDLVWLKLPSLKAARAAEVLLADLAAVEDLEGQIHRAYKHGVEPNPRVVRRCQKLKIGIEAYGVFFGYERGFELERELPCLKPSAAE